MIAPRTPCSQVSRGTPGGLGDGSRRDSDTMVTLWIVAPPIVEIGAV
jgi:hypothetical protein